MAQQHVVPRFLLPSSQLHSQPDAGRKPLSTDFAYRRVSHKPPGIPVLKINIRMSSQDCQRICGLYFQLNVLYNKQKYNYQLII